MRLKISGHCLALLVYLHIVSAVMNKRFIEYEIKFSGDLPEEILQSSYLPRSGQLSKAVIVGLSIQQDARPSDYGRLKKIAQILAPLTPRGRRSSKFNLQDLPNVNEVDNQNLGPVYRGPNKIIYETGDGEREVREVEEPGKSFQKLFAPSNYPLASTPKPRAFKKTTTTTTSAPPLDSFITETQEIFNAINYNLTLAEGLKMGHVVEFNRSVLGPAKENGVYISSKRISALNKLIVVNDNGVTCADICSQIKGERSGYGTIGLCTAKFCQCDFRSRNFNALDCPTDNVFDPILLACNSPRNVLLCDDGRFEEEVVPTTQKPPEYPPTSGDVVATKNMASYPAKVELVSNGIGQKPKQSPLGIMHVVRPTTPPQPASVQSVQEPGPVVGNSNEQFSEVSDYELPGMRPPPPPSTPSSTNYHVQRPQVPVKNSQEIIEMTPPPPPDSKTTYIITLVSPQDYPNSNTNPYQEILPQLGNPVGVSPPQSPQVFAYQSPQASAYQFSQAQSPQLHQISPQQLAQVSSYRTAVPQSSSAMSLQSTAPPASSEQILYSPTISSTSRPVELSTTTQEAQRNALQNEAVNSRPEHNLTYSLPPAPVYRPRGPTILQPVGTFQRASAPTRSAVLIQASTSQYETQISNLIDSPVPQRPLVLTASIGRPLLQTQVVPQIQRQVTSQIQPQVAQQVQLQVTSQTQQQVASQTQQQVASQTQQRVASQVQQQFASQVQPPVIPLTQAEIVPQIILQQGSNQQVLTTEQLKSIVGTIFQQSPVAVTNQIENYIPQSLSTVAPEPVQTYATLHGELMPPLPPNAPAEILRVTRAPLHFPHGLPNGRARLINAGTEKSPIYAYVNMQTYFVLPSRAINSTNV